MIFALSVIGMCHYGGITYVTISCSILGEVRINVMLTLLFTCDGFPSLFASLFAFELLDLMPFTMVFRL